MWNKLQVSASNFSGKWHPRTLFYFIFCLDERHVLEIGDNSQRSWGWPKGCRLSIEGFHHACKRRAIYFKISIFNKFMNRHACIAHGITYGLLQNTLPFALGDFCGSKRSIDQF